MGWFLKRVLCFTRYSMSYILIIAPPNLCELSFLMDNCFCFELYWCLSNHCIAFIQNYRYD